jgi:hypothetical protein
MLNTIHEYEKVLEAKPDNKIFVLHLRWGSIA